MVGEDVLKESLEGMRREVAWRWRDLSRIKAYIDGRKFQNEMMPVHGIRKGYLANVMAGIKLNNEIEHLKKVKKDIKKILKLSRRLSLAG